MKIYLTCLLLISTAYSFAAQPDKGVGVNVARLADWAPSMSYTNTFLKARAWIPQRSTDWTWDTGEPLNIRSDGWIASLAPNQEAATLVNLSIQGHYPGGVYHCFYDGEGTFSFGHDAKLIEASNNHCTVQVNPTNSGILFTLKTTNPSNPLRNFKLILPGYENSYQQNFFYPPFVNELRKYAVIRYMDWQKTNHSPVVNWSDRTPENYAIQTRAQGVALEHIIALSNVIGKPPWISVPHRATDDYVRQLATLFKNTLRSDLKVYVEYSNETWNGIFKQHNYVKEQAIARGHGQTEFWKFHSERSVEIFNIFTDVYGNADKVVRVLGGFSENEWLNMNIMNWRDAYKSADAMAIAPYFGHNVTPSTDVNSVLNQTTSDMRRVLSDVLPENLYETNKYNIALIAYEGGQHITATGSGGSACIDANRHDRMGDIYTEYLEGWAKATNNNLFMFWNNVDRYSQYGCWGLREWFDQTASTAPKYRAIMNYLGQTTTASPPLPPVLSPQIIIAN
jgi:hypothetical protein